MSTEESGKQASRGSTSSGRYKLCFTVPCVVVTSLIIQKYLEVYILQLTGVAICIALVLSWYLSWGGYHHTQQNCASLRCINKKWVDDVAIQTSSQEIELTLSLYRIWKGKWRHFFCNVKQSQILLKVNERSIYYIILSKHVNEINIFMVNEINV